MFMGTIHNKFKNKKCNPLGIQCIMFKHKKKMGQIMHINAAKKTNLKETSIYEVT